VSPSPVLYREATVPASKLYRNRRRSKNSKSEGRSLEGRMIIEIQNDSSAPTWSSASWITIPWIVSNPPFRPYYGRRANILTICCQDWLGRLFGGYHCRRTVAYGPQACRSDFSCMPHDVSHLHFIDLAVRCAQGLRKSYTRELRSLRYWLERESSSTFQ